VEDPQFPFQHQQKNVLVLKENIMMERHAKIAIKHVHLVLEEVLINAMNAHKDIVSMGITAFSVQVAAVLALVQEHQNV